MNFAKEQLSKHGWTEGQGLGRTENGITEAIKVKIKQNKTGVGHDPGEEFSYHWWDHVFNRAASKIKVETTETGVKVRNDGDTEVSKKKNSKKYFNKEMLYGQFIKGATLSDGTETVHKTQHADNSDDEEQATKVQCLMPDQAETVFKMCGGRTAHKGARHGLKLNGKLQRIEEQEKMLLEKYNKSDSGKNSGETSCVNDTVDTKKSKKSKKKKRKLEESENNIKVNVRDDMIELVDDTMDKDTVTAGESYERQVARKKKSKKSREMKDCDKVGRDNKDFNKVDEDDTSLSSEMNASQLSEINGINGSVPSDTKKSKKGKKRKQDNL